MKFSIHFLFAIFLALFSLLTSATSLDDAFRNPPKSAKPLTWFHAMSSNMSKEGVTKDLEAIAEAGIGGTILFNVSQGVPVGNVKFNSDQHIDIIGHMAKESERLDLSFGIHNCDGWTSSGGPWITPEHSMKKVVWSQTIVDGGEKSLVLAEPISLKNYYEDIAVIAYPSLPSELDDSTQIPRITASTTKFNSAIVTDGLTDEHALVDAKKGNEPWLQFEYEKPFTLRFIDLLVLDGRGAKFSLYTSEDGVNFSKREALPLRRPGKRVWALDATFDGVTSRYFRLYANKTVKIQEVRFSSTPTIGNYMGRTALARTSYGDFKKIGDTDPTLIIDPKRIRDLSSSMDDQGKLTTNLPEGKWTIMRFGYTTTGAVNIPASKEGTGLEVDKFSREAFNVHYGAYVTRVIDKVGAVAPGALHYMEIDSYEVGGQNWTQGYEKLFKNRFGYNLIPFLPLYSGKFVGSSDRSEAVLWDVRDLYGQLINENYYGYFTELANEDGVKTYIEPYGFGPFNDVDAGGKADIPMGEFWYDRGVYKLAAASSASHIYDKKIVSAEAFTALPSANWSFHPEMGKTDGDKSWALGVNEFVFHRFAHQANTHVVPGMTMNRWGVHFDRTQTWWNNAGKEWFKYMTRGQTMLRQGVSVADALWYLGDATPTSCPEKEKTADRLPLDINFDCLNSDVLINRLKVKKGKLVLPNGASYKLLYLTNHQKLNMASLEKIHKLAKSGAVIVGDRVEALAELDVSAKDKKKFLKMVDYIWSRKNTHAEADWVKVYDKQGFNRDLQIEGHSDTLYSHRKTKNEDIYFLYNKFDEEKTFNASFDVKSKIPELWRPLTGDTEKLATFASTADGKTEIALRLEAKESVFVVFRENAGKVEGLALQDQTAAHIVLNAENQPLLKTQINGTYRVAKSNGETQEVVVSGIPAEIALDGSWKVSFSGKYGLDKTFTFDTLVDWKDHASKEVRSYSGTAVYSKSFDMPSANFDKKYRYILDLGKVSIAAKIILNGRELRTSWMKPHVIDITDALVSGENKIQLEVANLWVNRLIADEAYPDTSNFTVAQWSNPVVPMPEWYTDNRPPPASKRFTFTTQPFYAKDDPLLSSGLLGPVNIKFITSVAL